MSEINGHVIPTAAVIAIGRFAKSGPVGYQATERYAGPDAPLRATRAEALEDIVAHLIAQTAETEARIERLEESA